MLGGRIRCGLFVVQNVKNRLSKPSDPVIGWRSVDGQHDYKATYITRRPSQLSEHIEHLQEPLAAPAVFDHLRSSIVVMWILNMCWIVS